MIIECIRVLSAESSASFWIKEFTVNDIHDPQGYGIKNTCYIDIKTNIHTHIYIYIYISQPLSSILIGCNFSKRSVY